MDSPKVTFTIAIEFNDSLNTSVKNIHVQFKLNNFDKTTLTFCSTNIIFDVILIDFIFESNRLFVLSGMSANLLIGVSASKSLVIVQGCLCNICLKFVKWSWLQI